MRRKLSFQLIFYLKADSEPEFRKADFAVPVPVDRFNHLVNLLVGHLPWKVLQHKLHLMGRDAALLVLAEHPEGVLEVSLVVQLLRLLLDDQTEVIEVKSACAIVNLVDQILNFNISRILPGSPQSVLEILIYRE